MTIINWNIASAIEIQEPNKFNQQGLTYKIQPCDYRMPAQICNFACIINNITYRAGSYSPEFRDNLSRFWAASEPSSS